MSGIFDAHLCTQIRSDDDLKNLRYFGTEGVVTVSYVPRRPERASEVVAAWERLVERELGRARSQGLEAWASLGVRPEERPRRAHPELWSLLSSWLERPEVVAVGPICVTSDDTREWELFDLQAQAARAAGVALIVVSPAEMPVTMTYKMLDRLVELGNDPAHCLLSQLPPSLLRPVREAGMVAGITVGPGFLDPRAATSALLEAHALDGSDRLVVSTAMGSGGADVLALPRLRAELSDRGCPESVIDAVTRGNARALYGLGAES